MPIKSATRASKITVQPLPPNPNPAPVGSLPTVSQVRPEVPEVVAQGESYFSRDSIGSTKFDSRMDFPPLPNNATLLKESATIVGKSISLSPQRPCAIASVDIFNSPGTSAEKTDKAIAETLEVADFNYKLLESDYDYVYEGLKASTATTALMKNLEDTATSNFAKLESLTATVSSLASSRDSFSQNLDVRLSWDNVSQKSSEYYSTFATRFGADVGEIGLDSIGINPQLDTGTAIVKRIEALVTKVSTEDTAVTAVGDLKVGLSRGYFAVDNRVKSIDMLFDDGQVTGYSSLTKLQKVAACSEFLSRVFIDTFTGMTGSSQISLPTLYSGSSIFEPQRLTRGNSTIPSHYEGIIDPSIKTLSTPTIEMFRSSVVESYKTSYESSKMKTGVENLNEVGSPLDIYTRLIGKVKDSFPTLYSSVETTTVSNPAEIYDAINLLYSMKQTRSSRQFNGFMRGVLLTTLLDPDYTFAASDSEEYDSVTESKSLIEDTGSDIASRTLKTKAGIKALAANSLENESSVFVDSIFSKPERLRNFPSVSQSYTKALLGNLDSRVSLRDGDYGNLAELAPNFDPESSATPTSSEIDGFTKNAPIARNIPSAIAASLPQGTAGYDGTIFYDVTSRISTFGRDDTGKTVANSIIDFYDEIVSVFEETYGKKIDEVSPSGAFYTRDGTCSKKAIIDVILECMGNLVSYFLSPGYISRSSASNSISRALGGSSTRATKASEVDTTLVKTVWYLGLNESFIEALDFCESVSQIEGDLNSAIASAYAGSGLSGTSDSSFYSDTLSSIVSDLYPRHRGTRLAIASIAGISSIIDSSSQNFSKAISDASESLSSLPADLRSDVLSSLTTEVASSMLLKHKFEIGVRQSLEESLTKHDISAAKWFYKNYRQDLSSSKVCIVAGLPAGFCSDLSSSSVQVSGNRASTGNLPMSRGLSKYNLSISSRSVRKPYESITPLIVGKFHPLVHVYLTSELADNLLPLEVASTGAASIMCFDKASASWVDVDYDECFEFLTNGGNFGVSSDAQLSSSVSRDEVEDMIEFHVLDAILKATIRVACGVNFDSMSLCSPAKSIDSVAAPKMLSLFGAASANLIPRGNMLATDYLKAEPDGSFTPIPFSSLAGEASDLTDPSTHSLLLKLLGSGIFTAGGSVRRVMTPPAFERVYCCVHDPSQLISNRNELESAASDVTLFSINITAE